MYYFYCHQNHLLPMDIMLEYKKTSRKNLQPLYFLLFYEIQKGGGGGPYVIFSTSKYQKSKILLSLE